MKKGTRFLIILFCIAVCFYFLIPTIRWYSFFTEEDKQHATLIGDRLKVEVDKKVNAALVDITAGKDLKDELKVIRKEFKKEIDKINKKNPVSKIAYVDTVSFKEMEKTLLDKNWKQKQIDILFRSSLEEFFKSKYEAKRKVKEGIIKLGLDLQGGAYAVVTVKFDDPALMAKFPKEKYPGGIPKDEKDKMIDSAVIKIENRINKFGMSETSIQKMKDQEKIIINLPGVKQATELRQIIETVGVLEFKIVSKEGSDLLNQLTRDFENAGKPILDKTGKLVPEIVAQLPPDTEALFVSKKDKWGSDIVLKEMLVVAKESLLGDNINITSASVQSGEMGKNVVNFELDGPAADKWAQVTGDNIGKEIAIILDNVILQHPVVKDKITGGRSQITLGDAPLEELTTLSLILRSGSLNVPLEISEENTVGASLGMDTIQKGLFASLLGSILVIIFMVIWYNLGGFIADIAVVLNISLLVCGLAMFKGTLTLPGLAGIVLTVGMAVDANVIIYERIKEEFRAGKTFKTAVSLGFDRAFWTILDSNLTTFVAGIGLSIFGTGPIKGFAVTLCLGIVTTLFTTLFVSRLMFDTLLSKKEFKSLRMLKLIGRADV